ncbi:MAG: 50S ribosomal protein L27 [Planctomycetia bacterium]|nr:50S ribosomal protein L27 [Planctomycetia bacterium]
MAHKKGQGASRNGRDSNGQRRGIKCYEGELVQPGNIILRQCGTKFIPGRGTRLARNCDIYAVASGTVKYQGKKVHILPQGVAAAPARPAAKPATPATK